MAVARCATSVAMAGDAPHRINLHLSGGLLAALDEWRRQERDIPTRSEAARRLIAQALKASGRIGADPEQPVLTVTAAPRQAPPKRGR
jgi:metal-responsive CopG/Arc/MetJ family transcriptional regulator